MKEDIEDIEGRLSELEFKYRSDRKVAIACASILGLSAAAFWGFSLKNTKDYVEDELVKRARDTADRHATEIGQYKVEIESYLSELESFVDGKDITRKRSVFEYINPELGYIRETEWKEKYYHIKTPVKLKSREMWRFDLTGYSYGAGIPLSLSWVGYTYIESPDLRQSHSVNWFADDLIEDSANTEDADVMNFKKSFEVEQYFGGDGFLYLKFGPLPDYNNSFVLDYQSGSSGTKISGNRSYSVILTSDDLEIK